MRFWILIITHTRHEWGRLVRLKRSTKAAQNVQRFTKMTTNGGIEWRWSRDRCYHPIYISIRKCLTCERRLWRECPNSMPEGLKEYHFSNVLRVDPCWFFYCAFVLSVLNTTRKWCTLHSGFCTLQKHKWPTKDASMYGWFHVRGARGRRSDTFCTGGFSP